MNPPGQRVDIGGRCLHFIAAGAGGPTVVFESGGGGGTSMSDLPLLRRISVFARGLIHDRAGLGWSDSGPLGRTFEERAGDLHALLERTDTPPPYVLVGSSFGGLGARAFCRRYPEEVAGMVLVDAAEEGKYFSTMARMRGFHEQELLGEARRTETGGVRSDLEERLAHTRAFSDAEKAALLELMSTPAHHLASLDELRDALDTTPAAMRAPGGFGALGDRPLIVLSHGIPNAGEMAAWEEGFMESQARLTALSSNSAHIVAAGVGHAIGLERPGLVIAAIRAVAEAAKAGTRLDVSAVERLAAGDGR
jgi:pimeloyl-ACP methyl ester carboxylesterase